MDTTFILLGYTYYTYCQGTRDRNYGTHLIKVPKGRSSSDEFITARETLYNCKHREYDYEIEVNSIENLTIDFSDLNL